MGRVLRSVSEREVTCGKKAPVTTESLPRSFHLISDDHVCENTKMLNFSV